MGRELNPGRNRRVCVVLATRGNYGKMKSTMRALRDHPGVDLQVVLSGAPLLARYGLYAPVIEADGFSIDQFVDFLVEGESEEAMAASAARATELMALAFQSLRPDIVVVVADRYEALSIAMAAMCLNITIAHLEGGEISGSIDERIRHAVTKLAHIHFPATAEAAKRIIRMGEDSATVHVVGSPSLDLMSTIDIGDLSILRDMDSRSLGGRPVDLTRPYVVVSQHPVVTEYADAEAQIVETAAALAELGLPAVWLLPNMDAGRDGVLRAVRTLMHGEGKVPVMFLGSLPLEQYLVLLNHARCLIGNSSSGIRECEYLGLPVVNIGSRQNTRERGANVVDVGYDAKAILKAVRAQIAHGLFPSQHIYGDGNAGAKIAGVLATAPITLEKVMTY